MKTKTGQPLVRGLFVLLVKTLRVVPWKPALAWGESVGALGYRLSKRYRTVADKNLRIAYGDTLTESERQKLIKRVFQNFARAMLVEFLKAPGLTPVQMREWVRADSLAPMHQCLARGKGLIVLSAHLGNWEWMARRIVLEGIDLLAVSRPSRDPEFDALTDRLREDGGYRVHDRGQSPRTLLQQLRRGDALVILPDQKSEDLFLPFFGRTAGTVAGPAVLALKTGAAILPTFAMRQPDGRFRLEFLPEIDTRSTGNIDADTRRIMTDINLAIETMIRRYPDQWLWLHDRWRLPAGFDVETISSPASPLVGARGQGIGA